MALALDATSSGVNSTHTVTGGTTTVSHVVGSGTNRALVVCVNIWHNGFEAFHSALVTYNGVAMQFVDASASANGSYYTEIWTMAAPASGTHNIVVYNGGVTDAVKVGAVSVTGANQTNPVDIATAAQGTSGTISGTITTSNASEFIVSCITHLSANSITPTSQTSVLSDTTIGVFGGVAYSTAASAGSNTVSWSAPDPGDAWAYALVALMPDTGTAKTIQSPRIVQTAGYSSGGGSTASASFTLPVAPTVGNILYACLSFYTGVDPVITPSGWTLVMNNETDTTAGGVIFSRVVQSGDGTSWTLTALTGTDSIGGALYEVSGQNATTPTNQVANGHNSTSSTTAATASVTPTVVGTLAIAMVSSDSGFASGDQTPTIGSGWVLDQGASPNYHALYTGHRIALTSDTTTAINTTFTNLLTSVNVCIILLIAPAATGGGGSGSVAKVLVIRQAVNRAGRY